MYIAIRLDLIKLLCRIDGTYAQTLERATSGYVVGHMQTSRTLMWDCFHICFPKFTQTHIPIAHTETQKFTKKNLKFAYFHKSKVKKLNLLLPLFHPYTNTQAIHIPLTENYTCFHPIFTTEKTQNLIELKILQWCVFNFVIPKKQRWSQIFSIKVNIHKGHILPCSEILDLMDMFNDILPILMKKQGYVAEKLVAKCPGV